jgi:hypothetical protein
LYNFIVGSRRKGKVAENMTQIERARYIHEPRLDTILMVENAIKESGSYPTKKELLESLPKKLQYQTFNRILNYLESSNKIMFDSRKIIWIFPDNPKLKRLLETSVKLKI